MYFARSKTIEMVGKLMGLEEICCKLWKNLHSRNIN
jgi:hypothetical protein